MSGTLEGPRKFAAEQGVCPGVATLEEVLARDDINAAVLATPTPLHAEQTPACAEAGTPAVSTTATSGCGSGSRPAPSPSSRWTCKRNSSAAPRRLRTGSPSAPSGTLRRGPDSGG
ncbi:hypothetical protein OG851_00775 [Streptomyces sp. NBC_00161]|uniref:hypothetical protein n=1 Tax=Streptomyces sp. NBC_00161 TaxID=2975671 RepID=UPI00324732CB